jgi:cell division initiation protein
MITPQDIREKTFEKAVFGGYDMGTVDDFMEEVANDMTLLQKENATLKGKMKVLVDKIEEYRSSEDALRMAILSAQKMGNMIEKEAQEKSDKMISDAIAEAGRITREANQEARVESERLAQAQHSSAEFIENMKKLCRKQMDFLNRLGDADFAKTLQSAPAADMSEIHETVKSIEETVAKAASEPVAQITPDIKGVVSDDGDERPTRAFDAVSIDTLDL